MGYTDINIPMGVSATTVKAEMVTVSGDETVAPSTAAALVLGTAFTDGDVGDKVAVITEGEVELLAGTGGVTAGAEVEAENSTDVITLAAGKRVGVALNTAAVGEKVRVLLK